LNYVKFFVYQGAFSIIGIANNYFFREFIYEHFQIHNNLIISLLKTPIDLVILYFSFRLYLLLETKLRYKIFIHIGAFIVGAVTLGVITNHIVMERP
jgi:hypothetical protein